MPNEHKIKYTIVDGMHFFTSPGGLTEGLCVASTDLKTAYDEVAFQMNHLLKENHGIEDAGCWPAVSFEVFEAFVEGAMKLATKRIHPVPSAVIDYFNKRDAA